MASAGRPRSTERTASEPCARRSRSRRDRPGARARGLRHRGLLGHAIPAALRGMDGDAPDADAARGDLARVLGRPLARVPAGSTGRWRAWRGGSRPARDRSETPSWRSRTSRCAEWARGPPTRPGGAERRGRSFRNRAVERLVDVAYVGRLIDEKRLDLLVDAVRALRDAGRSVRCVIAGEGPAREASLARQRRSGSATSSSCPAGWTTPTRDALLGRDARLRHAVAARGIRACRSSRRRLRVPYRSSSAGRIPRPPTS